MAIEVGPRSSLIYIDLPIKKWCFFSIVMLVDAQRHGTEGMEGTEAAWHGTKQRTLALELMAMKAKFLDHSAAWGKSMSGMMFFMFFS